MEQILDGMWDNLGRIVGEYPHIAKYSPEELMNIVELAPGTIEIIETLKDLRSIDCDRVYSHIVMKLRFVVVAIDVLKQLTAKKAEGALRSRTKSQIPTSSTFNKNISLSIFR